MADTKGDEGRDNWERFERIERSNAECVQPNSAITLLCQMVRALKSVHVKDGSERSGKEVGGRMSEIKSHIDSVCEYCGSLGSCKCIVEGPT